MSSQKQAAVVSTTKSGMQVGELRQPWYKRKSLALVALVVVVATGLTGAAAYYQHANTQKQKVAAQNAATQKKLLDELNNAESYANSQEVLQVSTRLINGTSTGQFKLNNNQLASCHMDKASALLDLKQYGQVTSEAQKAARLNSVFKLAALELEFKAQYDGGERKQLIPLLQQLVAQEQSSGDPMRGMYVAGYQDDIQALQNNQEIVVE